MFQSKCQEGLKDQKCAEIIGRALILVPAVLFAIDLAVIAIGDWI